MKSKSVLVILVSVFLITGLSAQNVSKLDDIINTAIENSHELKMLTAKINSSANSIEQNSNLPNPMLSFGAMNLPVNSLAFDQEAMTMKVVGISQEFPLPGTLGTKADINKKTVEIDKEEFSDKKNELIKIIKQNYFQLQFVRKEIELTEKQIGLMKDISAVVKTMYSVSETTQQNILKVDLELTNMMQMIAELKGDENETVSSLNSYMLRDANSAIITEPFFDISYNIKTVEDLIVISTKNRPYLIGIEKTVERAKLNQSLAEYEYYPMFKLSAQYGIREKIRNSDMSPDNMLSVMLDITLPLNYGGKVTSMVEETKSMQTMYREQYSASLQMLRKEYGMIVSKLNSLKERINIMENGSLIQAKENLTSALTAYQVGSIDFMNVIDAQSSLYSIEKNIYALKTEYMKTVSEAEFLTGNQFYK